MSQDALASCAGAAFGLGMAFTVVDKNTDIATLIQVFVICFAFSCAAKWWRKCL